MCNFLVQPKYTIDGLPFRRLHKLVVGNPNRMKGALHFALPKFQEGFKAWKRGSEVKFLPKEQLEQRRMIGDPVMDFRGRKAVPLKLDQKVLGHQKAPHPKQSIRLKR